MTVRAFLDRLEQSRFVVTITREPDGSIFLECDHGFRDATWTTIRPPCADGDPLDEELARLACRDPRIPPQEVGL